MSEKEVKRFDWFKHLTSFSAIKDENRTDFLSVKVPSHSSSCHPISQNSIPFIQIEVRSIYFISTDGTMYGASGMSATCFDENVERNDEAESTRNETLDTFLRAFEKYRINSFR